MSSTVQRRPGYSRPLRVGTYVFLTVIALLWLIPIAGAFYASLRPYSETQTKGIFSWPDNLSLSNYTSAWKNGGMGGWHGTFANTAFIVLPALFLILFLSSTMAFAVSRFSWRFNVTLLLIFTAGNLLPQQVIFKPLFVMFEHTPWPDVLSDTDTGHLLGTKIAVILIHVAFQVGFCTFVLANYMKTIPKEISEAAAVDGASVPRQYWQVVLPLTRPALAALATLEFTWLYNDFFWGSTLISQGPDQPITSSIRVLNGQYASDGNLIAAASIMIALPTLIVYMALQKHFISGLTLGANKG